MQEETKQRLVRLALVIMGVVCIIAYSCLQSLLTGLAWLVATALVSLVTVAVIGALLLSG